MSSKLLLGAAAGVLAGIGIAVLLKLKDEDDLFEADNFTSDFPESRGAGDYINAAKNKTEKIVRDAEEKSNIILEDAAKILAAAKEKISKIHYESKEIAEKEIEKIREEIHKSIDEFEKRIM